MLGSFIMDMDVHFSSWTMIIPTLITLFSFLAALFTRTTRSKPESNNLPPGPRKLPLIGNLHLFATSVAPHRVLADLAYKYGPLVHLQLGEVSTIVVSSPETAKEFLKTHDITFANRPNFVATEILNYGNTGIGFSPYGEHWRQLRKICTLELLSVKRVQSFRPLREKEFSDLCRWIASKQGAKINLTERIESTVCDIITQAAIGKRSDQQAVLISTIKEAIDLGAGYNIADAYPSIKLFRKIGGLKDKLQRLHEIKDKMFDEIINDHKLATGEGKQQEDLIDVLLKFNDPGHDPYLTTDNIKAVLMDIFGAGIDTSTSILDFAMAELLRKPTVLKKAQDEVRHVFSDKGFVDESDFDQLNYLKLVFKEVLRMHPPISILLPRENFKNCEVNGYKLAAKTRVLVNAWAIGRDPRYWRDAESFMPERYLDHLVDYRGNTFEYIPFGAGRRMCPGMSLGLANIELPLAMLLYHFDWVLPDGIKPENVDITECFSVTARRKYPLHVIPVVKNPLNLNTHLKFNSVKNVT